jgi:hypoxanthine phosphoribosyltransferase
MQRDIERVLISHSQIAQRIRELAAQITADHTPPVMPDTEITIIPILTGAMIFAADLIRQLPMRMRIGLLAVSSYPGRSIRSQGPNLLSQQLGDLSGRHVLLIDDILDSGGTIRMVRQMMGDMKPSSLKTCVLLRKPTPGAKETAVDYVGFDIPDEFVVGYGLDYDDCYRNLPEIVTLKRHVLERARKNE